MNQPWFVLRFTKNLGNLCFFWLFGTSCSFSVPIVCHILGLHSSLVACSCTSVLRQTGPSGMFAQNMMPWASMNNFPVLGEQFPVTNSTNECKWQFHFHCSIQECLILSNKCAKHSSTLLFVEIHELLQKKNQIPCNFKVSCGRQDRKNEVGVFVVLHSIPKYPGESTKSARNSNHNLSCCQNFVPLSVYRSQNKGVTFGGCVSPHMVFSLRKWCGRKGWRKGKGKNEQVLKKRKK